MLQLYKHAFSATMLLLCVLAHTSQAQCDAALCTAYSNTCPSLNDKCMAINDFESIADCCSGAEFVCGLCQENCSAGDDDGSSCSANIEQCETLQNGGAQLRELAQTHETCVTRSSFPYNCGRCMELGGTDTFTASGVGAAETMYYQCHCATLYASCVEDNVSDDCIPCVTTCARALQSSTYYGYPEYTIYRSQQFCANA